MVAFNLIDAYFIGQLGENELAAISFTFPVVMLIFSIIQGVGIGAVSVIAKSIGQGNINKAARETTDALLLGVIVSGFFIIVGILTLEPTFRLLGASDEVLPFATEYLNIWYYALFFVTVPFVGNSAIRATGDSITPSLIMLFAVIINAILDPLLIFGHWGFPELGLSGAAIATAISRAMTMVLSLWILYKREKLISLQIPSLKVLMGCWKAILQVGIPSGVSKMIVPITQGVLTVMLSAYGEKAIAGFGIGTRIEFLVSSLLFALAASTGPFTGQNYGAQKFERIEKAVKISNSFSILWGTVIFILLWFIAKPFASLFTDDPIIAQTTANFLRITSFFYGLQGVLSITNTNMNTLNKPLLAFMVIVIQMFFICIPVAYGSRQYFDENGIFIGIAAAYGVGGIASYFTDKYVFRQIVYNYKSSINT